MLSEVVSYTIIGVTAYMICVEVDISRGLPALDIVGLPDVSVRESKDRVRAAIRNSGFEFPLRRITVNLAPAHLRKVGPWFDLPLAIGILAASGQLKAGELKNSAIVGELSLRGDVKPAKGVISAGLCFSKEALKRMIVPYENGSEAVVSFDGDVFAVKTLKETVSVLNCAGSTALLPKPSKTSYDSAEQVEPRFDLDWSDVKGQKSARRALEIAVAGFHNVLMIGPPGAGKTMLAMRLPTIAPKLSWTERLEISQVYSAAGMLPPGQAVVSNRPFRTPHHTCTVAGMIGGGPGPYPGEVSLAHRGILFLDELPEFKPAVLEALRQPLEAGQVVISRSGNKAVMPCDFMLVCAMNPCPCGYLGDEAHECRCDWRSIQRYRSRLSGPLLDRIDITIWVRSVRDWELNERGEDESSIEVRRRVEKAVMIQLERFASKENSDRRADLPLQLSAQLRWNSRIPAGSIGEYCDVSPSASSLIKSAVRHFGLSVRGVERTLRVARTIADLSGSDKIADEHVAEALDYRTVNIASIETR